MKSLYRAGVLALAAGAAVPAWADESESKFEGAAGLVLSYKPAFSGSSDFKLKPELAGFLRWGRITITGAGGFTTRRQDDVERGLDAQLLRLDNVKVNLSLRFDGGRKQSTSGQLAGMGDIEPTVRAQLGVRWKPVPDWELSLGSSVDALNRVGGYIVSAGVARTFVLDGRQRVILGAAVSGAGDRYLQAWYGVTPEQSTASGYAAYAPSEGLRDLALAATYRIEYDRHWAGFAGASASRLLGPAAQSPLTTQRNGWALSAGIARRF
jgi:MipA family protein